MTWLTWITAILSLTGTVLNIRKNPLCFALWAITNAVWTLVDFKYGLYAQGALQAVYCGLALWGMIAWRERKA